MICTFFGHRDCPERIKPILKKEIERLISEGVNIFYVGNKGNFDLLVYACLKELKEIYPFIEFYIILEKIPSKNEFYEFGKTLIPEGVEEGPPRFAIERRNKWMIEKCEYVIV